MTDWYPEGGFYENRAKQGESVWEDQANYDPPLPQTTEDMRADAGETTVVSFQELIAAESYDQGPSQIYGASPRSDDERKDAALPGTTPVSFGDLTKPA